MESAGLYKDVSEIKRELEEIKNGLIDLETILEKIHKLLASNLED